MMIRRQLPVASPLTAANIVGATIATITRRDASDRVRNVLAAEFDATQVLLTDSGTSALVLALRMFAKAGAPVAMPAYACVDLIAAARRADVRVRLFDVDPHTLSPDMDSLQRVLAEGVSAVVIAHLYGFPADMPSVMKMARAAGVPVIEDAAQHAGATVAEDPVGSFGDVTVLSFGRGKGTTAGSGGALLRRRTIDDRGNFPSSSLPSTPSAGVLAITTATWILGRPSIYGIPASIPSLHLGETVYHDAGEPRRMSRAAVALLDRTLPGMRRAARARQANASILRDAADQSRNIDTVRAIETGESGCLRFPVLLRDDPRDNVALGIARGYPNPLSLEPQIQPCLIASHEPLHGAHELARRLVTLPTHHMVTTFDRAELSSWLRKH
jgi:perosamine synthetase